MARPLKPFVRGGGYYPSNRWTPLVYPGGYTTANGGGQPEPEPVLKTVTGSLIHITDALALPAEALTVNVEPIQAGTGDPSPDNVRPISGWTGANVTRTGKNLLDDSIVFQYSTSIVSVGGNYPSYYIYLKAGTYTFSTDFLNGAQYGAYFKGSEEPSNTIIWASTSSLTNASFTLTRDDYYRFWLYSSSGVSAENIGNCQLEYGSTASAYEPYQSNTYTIQFGNTVYGGTLDVTAGKMVVDRAFWTKNTTDMNNTESYPGWKNSGVKSLIGAELAEPVSAILNIGSQFSVNTRGNNDILFLAAGAYGKTQTEWQALAIDVQIVVPLAAPIEITLTPTQIEMLLGENNLWADAGDSTLTYYAEGEASTSEALGILLGGTYNNHGGADDVSDDEALGILLGGS